LKSSSKLNMPTRFIPELLGRQICLASDLCTTAGQSGHSNSPGRKLP
jgi:hypothetical protein